MFNTFRQNQMLLGRHFRGNHRGGAGSAEVNKFAQELRDALLGGHGTRGRGGRCRAAQEGSRARKPEWQCAECGVLNFMDRQSCRRCNEPWAPSASPTQAKSPPASGPRTYASVVAGEGQPGPQQRPQRATFSAAALEKARDAAADAGNPDEALHAMDRQIESLRVASASARPWGARLDSARAKVARTTAKLARTETALAEATRRRDETAKASEDASQELCRFLKIPEARSF